MISQDMCHKRRMTSQKGKRRHTQTTSKKRRLKKRRSNKTSFFICQEFSWFSEKIGKSTLKVINFYFYINVWIRFLTLTRKEIKWDPRKDGLKNFRKNLLFYLFCFFCEKRNWRWGSIIQWVAPDWSNGVNLLLKESICYPYHYKNDESNSYAVLDCIKLR